LPACLLACLPACLLACLPACLLACLPACIYLSFHFARLFLDTIPIVCGACWCTITRARGWCWTVDETRLYYSMENMPIATRYDNDDDDDSDSDDNGGDDDDDDDDDDDRDDDDDDDDNDDL